MQVLLAAVAVCCLTLLALAYAGQFPSAGPSQPSVVQLAQKQKKGKDSCFNQCISNGKQPAKCNQQCS
jgi:hypothetical protein